VESEKVSNKTISSQTHMDTSSQRPVHFTGHRYLTQRLVLATLSGKPIRISKIRSSSVENPGLAPHEISFCRLLDSITNGSEFVFSETGTQLLYRPGLIKGSSAGYGATASGEVRHELPATIERSISWFLIPLCMLAPFSVANVNVRFIGPGVITSATENGDVSVDTVRTAILPMYEHFGIMNKLEIRTTQRSNAGPDSKGGAGEVQLIFGHQVRLPKTIHLLNPGRIKSIRGVAYATGVAGANNARMIEAARGILNPLVSDTRIFSENTNAGFVPAPDRSNPRARKKIGIGFGLSLVAETSTGMRYSADAVSPVTGGVPPEDIGKQCAYQLLEVVEQGGCATAVAAPTMVTLMAMGSEDVGRLMLGKDVVGSEDIIQLARDFKGFGLSGWGLRDAGNEAESGGVVVSIVGKGVGNVGRKIA
jgi:RNA 3'-terminal phosphate cyclase-like protein